MVESVEGPLRDTLRSRELPARPEASSEALINGLCRVLADAAGRGVLLASGPLSRRKTDWVLERLAEELLQAERLVEALKQQGGASADRGEGMRRG